MRLLQYFLTLSGPHLKVYMWETDKIVVSHRFGPERVKIQNLYTQTDLKIFH